MSVIISSKGLRTGLELCLQVCSQVSTDSQLHTESEHVEPSQGFCLLNAAQQQGNTVSVEHTHVAFETPRPWCACPDQFSQCRWGKAEEPGRVCAFHMGELK